MQRSCTPRSCTTFRQILADRATVLHSRSCTICRCRQSCTIVQPLGPCKMRIRSSITPALVRRCRKAWIVHQQPPCHRATGGTVQSSCHTPIVHRREAPPTVQSCINSHRATVQTAALSPDRATSCKTTIVNDHARPSILQENQVILWSSCAPAATCGSARARDRGGSQKVVGAGAQERGGS